MSGEFRFKKFSVRQDNAAMKVGTDSVLLGAWCTMQPEIRNILDVGAGTGLLSLMLAQRSEQWRAEITAVEIDGAACIDASHNFSVSSWADRLKLINCRFQDYALDFDGHSKFDLIITNPPYFNNFLHSPSAVRTTARHSTHLSFEELISLSEKILAAGGRFAVVLPLWESQEFISTAARYGFQPRRIAEMFPRPDSAPVRRLMEFARVEAFLSDNPAGFPDMEKIVIERGQSRHDYTEEYQKLTGGFYLKF